jgi:hypothetical protein
MFYQKVDRAKVEKSGIIGTELLPDLALNLLTNYEGGSCYILPAIALFFLWHHQVKGTSECLNTRP